MSELTSNANKITQSGSGVDCSWDCSRVDCALFEALINLLLVPEMTKNANKIAQSGSGFDSSQDYSSVDCVLFDIYSGQVVPGLIQVWTKF